jgi:ABC-2 type transport system ATP-binding protein
MRNVSSVFDLRQGYGKNNVLKGVSFSLPPGVTTLLGVNGAGKTTLLRTLVGELKPWSGSISWGPSSGPVESPLSGNGAVSRAMSSSEFRHRTGYLPQDPQLPGRMRLDDMIAYAAWLKDVPYRRTRAAVLKAVAQVGLEDRLDAKIKTLSGGMRSRAALAAAVVHDPAILILDEPTSGLDPQQRIEIRQLIQSLAESRVVVVSTHLLSDISCLGGQVVVLHDGRVVFSGTADELEAKADRRAPGGSLAEQAFMTLLADPS